MTDTDMAHVAAREPRTEAGRALLKSVRAAVLDPSIAKLIGDDGRQQLVSLVSVELLETVISAIEAEARRDAEREIGALRDENRRFRTALEALAIDDGRGFDAIPVRLRNVARAALR